jgi:hypothetical protein
MQTATKIHWLFVSVGLLIFASSSTAMNSLRAEDKPSPIVTLSEAEFRDKVHACWLGKNIGGTVGTPVKLRHFKLVIKKSANPQFVNAAQTFELELLAR